ncbi:MAG: DUF5906 domain-containing protein [Lachnospiraceae bacterium]|nr:DUF5906 domain-containing protein [Lachnospiraceae bacterium]
MKLNIYTADCVGNKKNCLYPNRAEATSAEELAEALAYDHTCGQFKGNYRSTANFEGSDLIVMDFDNDGSDDPADWHTLQGVADEMRDISVAVAPSRHNMIPKDGRDPRPKGHAYFPIEYTDDPEKYAAIKRGIQKKFPFFDDNAMDAARFIYGADVDPADIIWQEGWMNIDEDVEPDYGEDEEQPDTKGVIPNGSRNKTLSRFAGRILKKLGECDKAHEVFLQEAEKCETPLPDDELKTIWYSALRFYRNKVSRQDGYVPPDQYNNDFAGEPGSMKPDDFSDIGEAKVLVKEYGGELKYADATDYLRYDGDCWREDRQMAVGAAEEFLDLQLADAEMAAESAKEALLSAGVSRDAVSAGGRKLEKEITKDLAVPYFRYLGSLAYLAFVRKRRDYKYIVSMMNAAKPMVLLSVNDLDRDGNLLNTPEGTYDLSEGTAGLRPHSPDDYITKITECSVSDDGMDIWLAALDLFFCGDQELISYVQEEVGTAAVGKVYQEHLIMAYGDGANGKSTFWNALFRVLGNYAGKMSAEALTMNCKRNVKPEMAELKGKRLIIASEMEEGMRLNTAVVKQLCSTDEIFAEKKYKAPFYFVPSHTLVLYTNHLPRIGANDDGIWRRLVVIPFNAKITGSSDIKNYADYLVENAGGAILRWIIEGAQKAIQKEFKLSTPQCVQDAVAAYREDNDWFGHFIAECCDEDPAASERSGELYQQYRAYCQASGEYTRSTTDFYAAIDKAGYRRHKTNKGSMIDGLRLKAGSDFV